MKHVLIRSGDRAVGQINDLDDLEAKTVEYLRRWGEGTSAQNQIETELCVSLGRSDGTAAFAMLCQICEIFAFHGRRPLVRHQIGCGCVGADEACFANMIGSATRGAREDAALVASLMVRPDFSLILADLACEFGLALERTLAPFADLRATHVAHGKLN